MINKDESLHLILWQGKRESLQSVAQQHPPHTPQCMQQSTWCLCRHHPVTSSHNRSGPRSSKNRATPNPDDDPVSRSVRPLWRVPTSHSTPKRRRRERESKLRQQAWRAARRLARQSPPRSLRVLGPWMATCKGRLIAAWFLDCRVHSILNKVYVSPVFQSHDCEA